MIGGSRSGVCSHLWDPGILQHLHWSPLPVLPLGNLILNPSRWKLARSCPFEGLSWAAAGAASPAWARGLRAVPWHPCMGVVLHCSSTHPHVLSHCKCSLPDGWLYSLIKLSCSNSSWKIQFRGSIVKNSVSLSTLLSPHFFCHLTPIMGC